MTGAKVRLIVASALFFGWLGWLGYTALSKSRAPVVSRAQAAATTTPVVAELTDVEGSPNVLVKVIEPLAAGGPTSETLIEVSNLKDKASGRKKLTLFWDLPTPGRHGGRPLHRIVGAALRGGPACPLRVVILHLLIAWLSGEPGEPVPDGSPDR
jgi:hypothetical protein